MGRIVVLLGVLAMLAAACGGAELTERIIESQEGVGDVEIDENSGSVVIEFEDEEGETAAVIGGGEIPADFPVPVPDGGSVAAVVESGGISSVSIEYPGDQFDSLKSFYESWAAGAGEVLTSFESSNPSAATWVVQDGDITYNVSLAHLAEEVLLTVVVEN